MNGNSENPKQNKSIQNEQQAKAEIKGNFDRHQSGLISTGFETQIPTAATSLPSTSPKLPLPALVLGQPNVAVASLKSPVAAILKSPVAAGKLAQSPFIAPVVKASLSPAQPKPAPVPAPAAGQKSFPPIQLGRPPLSTRTVPITPAVPATVPITTVAVPLSAQGGKTPSTTPIGTRTKQSPSSSINSLPSSPSAAPPHPTTLVTIIHKLQAHSSAFSFLEPVNPILHGVPDYLDIIKTPMDLSTLLKSVQNYQGNDLMGEVNTGMGLIVSNCYRYNHKGHHLRAAACALLHYYTALVKEEGGWVPNWKAQWGVSDYAEPGLKRGRRGRPSLKSEKSAIHDGGFVFTAKKTEKRRLDVSKWGKTALGKTSVIWVFCR